MFHISVKVLENILELAHRNLEVKVNSMKKIKIILGNMKMRYKLMLIYLCIGFLPFFILGVVFYIHVRNLIIEEEYMSSLNYVTQATQSLDNNIKIYNSLSDYLSFNQVISNTLTYQYEDTYDLYQQITKVIDPSINSIKYFHNDVKRITIYTDNHDIKHDTIIAPIDTIKDQEWYEKASLSSQIQWYVDKDNQIAYSVRKMPMLDRQGVEGILYIEIDYQDIFQSYSLGEFSDYDLFVLQNNQTLLYEEHRHEKEKSMTLEELSQLEKTENKNFIQYTSEETGWSICFYRLSMTHTKRLTLLTIIIVIAIVLSMILTCIALVSTSRLIVGRIEQLMNHMKRVEKGELEVNLQNEYKDEIGSLIEGFQKMVMRIRRLIQEVYIEKLIQKEYEMRALQQQINPHFLYNTLSMINFKALEVGENDISKITLALSSFYRTSLNKGKNTCTIKDEINNMKAYMDIQLMMHDYLFDFECEVDENILSCETLNLILQPIVENSIKHGIDLLDGSRRGLIKVYASLNDGIVYIMIEDNGVGMDQETMALMLSQNSKGYGMKNVHERIQLYYGQEYGLHIESVINQGTIITVKIPEIVYKG